MVDSGLFLLLRLVDLIERGLHHGRRTHGRELNLLDLNSQAVLGAKIGQTFQRGCFDVMPSNCEHFIHGAVANHFAHNALGKIAQRLLRLAGAEKVQFRIGDAILHDPRNEGGVEIARDHCLGFLRFPVALVDISRVRRSETELELQ